MLLRRDCRFSERFVAWDSVMSAALNVRKNAEWTGLLPQPAGNSLRNYFTFGVANALSCSNKRLWRSVSRSGT